eukprot:458144_1
MKIKIVYGVDMRLFKFGLNDDEPEASLYNDLVNYVCKSFQFNDRKDFDIKVTDDNGNKSAIESPKEFEIAYISAKKQSKKSFKIFISDAVAHAATEMEGKENDVADDDNDEKMSQINTDGISPSPPPVKPTKEEIEAFFGDEFVIDLLSDLFVEVFTALKESNFEIPFMECVQGIILSSSKYEKITANKVYPYFEKELLAKHCDKIEAFLVPMMRFSDNFDPKMIKQWIPTLLMMMKAQQQTTAAPFGGHPFFNGPMGSMFGGPFPPNQYGGHYGHHHGHGGRRGYRGHRHGRRHGHRGHRGRGRGRGRRGHRGRGHRGRGHRHGHNHEHHHGHHGYHGYGYYEDEEAAYNVMDDNNDDDMIEQEVFEYTEELAAIMAMGFNNMTKIKELLNEHHGNKQNVVQTLILTN